MAEMTTSVSASITSAGSTTSSVYSGAHGHQLTGYGDSVDSLSYPSFLFPKEKHHEATDKETEFENSSADNRTTLSSKNFLSEASSVSKDLAKTGEADQSGDKRLVSKLRISRADMEIITSQYPSEPVTQDGSDSEDMCRVFAATKKKKKHKKKKKKNRSSSVDSDFVDSEGDGYQRRQERNETILQKTITKPLENPNILNTKINDGLSNSKCVTQFSESTSNAENDINETCEIVTSKSAETTNILQPQQINNQANDSYSNSHVVGIFSSEEQNVNNLKSSISYTEVPSRARSGIKLPKPRKKYFKADDPMIKKTFPNCYVILKSIGKISEPCLKEEWSSVEAPLDLAERIQFLKKKFGRVSKSRKDKASYKHLFDENTHSEEEFQIPVGGKSLRRRNKNISYKEPSEFLLPFAEELDLDDDSLWQNKKSKKSKQDKAYIPEENTEIEKDSGNKKKRSRSSKTVVSPNVSVSSASQSIPKPRTVNKTPTTIEYIEKRSADGKTIICYPKTLINPTVSNVTTLSTSTNLQPRPSTALPQIPITFPGSMNLQNIRTPISSTLTSPALMNSFPMQVPVSTATSKPQYCMMKVDGKDVLVQLMPSTTGGAPQQVIVPGGKSYIMNQQNPRSIAPAFARTGEDSVRPRIMPNRFVPSTSIATGGLLINQPMVGNRIPLPLIGQPQLTGLPASSVRIPVVAGTQSSVATLGHVGAIGSSSGVTVRPLGTGPIQAGTSIRANAQAISTGPGGVRSLRLFVPGCTATGTPGHFTTLTTANVGVGGSPLTRLTASSQLLPQKKRSADTDLSAEQKAAKRRKLEKRYPLPPGVVIKTESLDPPPSSNPSKSVTSGMRSLLQQNIQVFSTPRGPGSSGMQSIRIVSPSTTLSTRPSHINQTVRPVMVRTSNVRGSTLLVPYTVSSSGSSSVVTISTSSPLNSCPVTLVSSTSAINNSTPSDSASSDSTNSINGNLSNNSLSSVPNMSPSIQRSSSPHSNHAELEASQAALKSLRQLVNAQTALGLKGERMDKLKILLEKKEATVKALLKSAVLNCQNESVSENINGHDNLAGSEVDPFVID